MSALSIVSALTIVLLQVLTGAAAWRMLRGRAAGCIESLGMGIALGTAAASLSGVLLWAWLPRWGWLVPSLIVGAIALIRPSSLHLYRPRNPVGASGLIGIVAGLILGAGSLLINVRSYPLHWTGSVTSYHPDMLFFEALSSSLAVYGPQNSIFMAGADIRYHWLTYAWSGQIAELAGTEPFFMLTRILPAVSLAGAIFLAVSWTGLLTRSRWAPAVAAALIVSGGYVGAVYGTILNFDSPSQQLSTVWLLGLLLALWLLVQPQSWPARSLTFWVTLGAVGGLGAATTLGKVSAGFVGLAAWGFVALIASLRGEAWARRAWAGLGAGLLGAVWVSLDFILGSAQGGGLGLGGLLDKASSVQGLNPVANSWGIVAGTVLLTLTMAARWAGLGWLVLDARTRWHAETVLGVGLVLVSVLTLLLISGGLNDTWFALAASAPLAIFSALGVSRAARRISPSPRPRGGLNWLPARPFLLAVTWGAALALMVAWVWSFGPESTPFLRWTAPLLAFAGSVAIGIFLARDKQLRGTRGRRVLAMTIVVLITMASLGRLLNVAGESFTAQQVGARPTEFSPYDPFLAASDLTLLVQWSDDQRDAGTWLADNAGVFELGATNITFSTLVPALSGRQTLMSGIAYQAPYGREELLPEILLREEISTSFINRPSQETLEPLCSSGVTWIWVDLPRTDVRDWTPYANVVFSNTDTAIARLDDSSC